ncbi:MAG TPA: hypothetical protein ENK64_00140 [Flavobacteriales bacterium]|nr:hypothetical protein [Flavobacteriales bacterium]
MKTLSFFKVLILILINISILMVSCSSKLDFKNNNQLNIQPVIEGDILYFDLKKDNLTNTSGTILQVAKDTVDFEIFKDHEVRDAFLKAIITIAYKNSFSRQFLTNIYFTDDQYRTVEEASFQIPAATSNTPEVKDTIYFNFDKSTNPNFINFRKIIITTEITPNQLPIEDKSLHVQLKGQFFTNITIE